MCEHVHTYSICASMHAGHSHGTIPSLPSRQSTKLERLGNCRLGASWQYSKAVWSDILREGSKKSRSQLSSRPKPVLFLCVSHAWHPSKWAGATVTWLQLLTYISYRHLWNRLISNICKLSFQLFSYHLLDEMSTVDFIKRNNNPLKSLENQSAPKRFM